MKVDQVAHRYRPSIGGIENSTDQLHNSFADAGRHLDDVDRRAVGRPNRQSVRDAFDWASITELVQTIYEDVREAPIPLVYRLPRQRSISTKFSHLYYPDVTYLGVPNAGPRVTTALPWLDTASFRDEDSTELTMGNETTKSGLEDVTVTTIIPFSDEFTPPQMLEEAIETMTAQVGVDAKPLVVEDEHQRGPAWARNVGLERAETRYVAFLDGDDLWRETKLRDQLQRMQESGAGMCVEGDTEYSTDEFVRGIMRSELFALTSSIVVDTDRTDVRFHEGLERREDHLYMMEVASEVGVCFVPDCFEARKYEKGLSQHVDRAREQVDEFYGIVARRVPEARRYHDDYFATALVGLGRAKHHDGDYRTALEQYVDAFRYNVTIEAIGAIGLTILAILYSYPRRVVRRLTKQTGRAGGEEGVDQ